MYNIKNAIYTVSFWNPFWIDLDLFQYWFTHISCVCFSYGIQSLHRFTFLAYFKEEIPSTIVEDLYVQPNLSSPK